MIAASNVSFRASDVPMENVHSGDKQVTMDIIEIKFPDGKVAAFPATDVSPESGQRYCDIYKAKYEAFKNGQPDPDRVDQLKREIAERENELTTLHGSDDWRVQGNLGYGRKTKQPKAAKKKRAA